MSVPVELGFLGECQPWLLESRFFPSKVGGKPAWLSLEHLPKPEELQCPFCKNVMIFLCQIYSPFEEETLKNYEVNFHRTIFVFICRNSECSKRNDSSNVKVFRSCLKRENKFYSYEPPVEEPDSSFSISKICTLCELCGSHAEKKCSNCKTVNYCSREHQILDWKESHKSNCNNNTSTKTNSKLLFSEWELITETEELENEVETNEEEELAKFEKLKQEGKSGTLSELPESELDAHASVEKDKTFLKFKKKVSQNPDQVIRYNKGQQPLWIAKEPVPNEIPNCEYCGAQRQFEFQIMPQMLSILKENSIDFGVISVFTCKDSCISDNIYTYKKEFAFKQDVELNDNI